MVESNALKEFCRDTMQFSEHLFDQYSVFANAVKDLVSVKSENTSTQAGTSYTGAELLRAPAENLQVMVRWLRLRDPFLVGIAVEMTKKVLNRLTEVNLTVDEITSRQLEQIVLGSNQIRTHLTPHEKAELAQSLETNLGRPVVHVLDADSETPSDFSNESTLASKTNRKIRSTPIDLESWRANAKRSGLKLLEPQSAVEGGSKDKDDSSAQQTLDPELLSASRSVDMMKQMKMHLSHQSAAQRALPAQEKSKIEVGKHSRGAVQSNKVVRSDAQMLHFREKRDREKEAKKRRDAENLAMVKKRAGLGGKTLGEGSGLAGLGIKGKDHAPTGPGMMFSSGSESESEDELDKELFGTGVQTVNHRGAVAGKIFPEPRKPVKKMKQVRSAKDMRARLAPDLAALHKEILGWDYFSTGHFPPGHVQDEYQGVAYKFRNPLEYRDTFTPLLLLEAWQSFLQSKEEGSSKTFESKVANRMNVDSFIELSTSISTIDAKDLGVSEADIVLMSKSQSPAIDGADPHWLARVSKISRKKAAVEVTYRVGVNNTLVPFMVPNTVLYCVRVLSITPLEREYGALSALQYFDLCDEIVKAKPSPLLEYSENQLSPLKINYTINSAQAKSV